MFAFCGFLNRWHYERGWPDYLPMLYCRSMTKGFTLIKIKLIISVSSSLWNETSMNRQYFPGACSSKLRSKVPRHTNFRFSGGSCFGDRKFFSLQSAFFCLLRLPVCFCEASARTAAKISLWYTYAWRTVFWISVVERIKGNSSEIRFCAQILPTATSITSFRLTTRFWNSEILFIQEKLADFGGKEAKVDGSSDWAQSMVLVNLHCPRMSFGLNCCAPLTILFTFSTIWDAKDLEAAYI